MQLRTQIHEISIFTIQDYNKNEKPNRKELRFTMELAELADCSFIINYDQSLAHIFHQIYDVKLRQICYFNKYREMYEI